MNNNIIFDAITNTIIITKGFYAASKEFGSEAQKKLADIQKEYPYMKIAVKSTRTGYKRSEYKGLTYDYMRRFIRIMDRENIVTFDDVIAHYEDFGYDSGKLYQCVKDWFLETYPNHKEMIVEATPIRLLQETKGSRKRAKGAGYSGMIENQNPPLSVVST